MTLRIMLAQEVAVPQTVTRGQTNTCFLYAEHSVCAKQQTTRFGLLHVSVGTSSSEHAHV